MIDFDRLETFINIRVQEDLDSVADPLDTVGMYFTGTDITRVRRECESKQSIMRTAHRMRINPDLRFTAQEILRYLAAPYADHPDYREAVQADVTQR